MAKPSREETKADPTRTLVWLTARINSIYDVGQPRGTDFTALHSFSAHMETHATVYDFCTTSPGNNSRDRQILYNVLKQGVTSFCQDSLAIITEPNDTDRNHIASTVAILELYLEQWRAFMFKVRNARIAFQSFQYSHDIMELHWRAWREEVLGARILPSASATAVALVLPVPGGFTNIVDAMIALQQEEDGQEDLKQGDLKQEDLEQGYLKEDKLQQEDVQEDVQQDFKQEGMLNGKREYDRQTTKRTAESEKVKQEDEVQQSKALEDLRQEDLKQEGDTRGKKNTKLLEECIGTLQKLGLRLSGGGLTALDQ